MQKGGRGGGSYMCNSRAILVQQCGQCRWAGEYQHVSFVYRSLEVEEYLAKAETHYG